MEDSSMGGVAARTVVGEFLGGSDAAASGLVAPIDRK